MSGSEKHIFGVAEVNQFIKTMLDGVPALQDLYVRGELSNYKIYPSGHHYFTLKDPEGVLRCVMFRSSAAHLRFRPENGMKVIVRGRITAFVRDGQYQLYCDAVTPEGAGDLAVAFEQLKARLYQEGLFDASHKKPLPPFPQRIAIITSGSGAAVHDMLRILRRRYPICKVIVLPVRVQGVEAAPEIVGAIRYANRWRVADLIITGRGGGSMEDLWAFNDERVARAIYESELPVISAVGHEPDVTISDFVADVRRPRRPMRRRSLCRMLWSWRRSCPVPVPTCSKCSGRACSCGGRPCKRFPKAVFCGILLLRCRINAWNWTCSTGSLRPGAG